MTMDLRYPHRTLHSAEPSPAFDRMRRDLVALPKHLEDAVAGLNDSQLDTPYRPGGWTVRQVVHHVADSHLHAFVRLKVALTEDRRRSSATTRRSLPSLADTALPVDVSLQLLRSLHARWVAIYDAMPDSAGSGSSCTRNTLSR